MRSRESGSWQTDGRLWGRLKTQARKFRREPTTAESILWTRIRNGQLGGYRFRRQHTVGQYVLDFYCWREKLAIEIDGPIHATRQTSDATRDTFLNLNGIRVIRFANEEVIGSIEGVVAKIVTSLTS